jgi:hypothetical protein
VTTLSKTLSKTLTFQAVYPIDMTTNQFATKLINRVFPNIGIAEKSDYIAYITNLLNAGYSRVAILNKIVNDLEVIYPEQYQTIEETTNIDNKVVDPQQHVTREIIQTVIVNNEQSAAGDENAEEGPEHTAWRTHANSWYDVNDKEVNRYGYTTDTEPPFNQFASKHTAAGEASNNIVQKKINDTTVWSQVLGSRSRTFNRKGNPGSVAIGWGLIIGLIQHLTKTDTLGTSLSFNHTGIKGENSTSKTSIATYLATLTYAKNIPFISFNISAFYGVSRNDVLNLNDTGYGYLSKIQGMALGVSKPFAVNNLTLTPTLAFNGILTNRNEYRDSAASLYKEKTTGTASSTLTLGASYKFAAENKDEHTLSLIPSISLNHTPKPRSFTVNTTTSVIQINPERQHPLTYALGAGYQFKRNDISFDVNYTMQLRSQYIGQNLTVKANYAF